MLKALLFMIFLSVTAHAGTVEVDNGQGDAFFKANGKRVTAAEAVKAYDSGEEIEKCAPVKGAVNASGGSAEAFKCKLQKRVLNGKTGNETWKAK